VAGAIVEHLIGRVRARNAERDLATNVELPA
jgi:hypothetical protein